MAGKKLNFAIAINMTTDQFRKGAEMVKSSLRSLQYQVLGMVSAFGFGAIGLNNLIKSFIETARETNRARIALSNVSDGASGFAKNMTFLSEIAQKYGQELNGLTLTFARFSAASNAVGVKLSDQHKIYEAMAKAVTAFQLSSSEAQLTYMALGQMMSKGRVTAEELRRQMGERIPIAMEAMARAAGVTVQELDALLKQGKVYSAEVLPKFADELNKMLEDINVDNIETSVNRLRNSFIKLTDSLKVGDLYKKILDGLTKLLSNIQNTWQRFAVTIATAIVSGKIVKAMQNFSVQAAAQDARLVANAQNAERQKEIAVQNRIAKTRAFEELDKVWQASNLEERARLYVRYQSAKVSMEKAANREIAAIRNAADAQEALRVYRSTSLWQKAGVSIKNAMTGVLVSIGNLFKTLIPVAIISALANFLMKMREIRKESERINDIFNDYKEGINNLDLDSEAVKINAALSILEDKKSTQDKINNAQAVLNGLLGTEIENQDTLIEQARERLKLLKANAELQYHIDAATKAQGRIEEIERSYGGKGKIFEKKSKESIWVATGKSILKNQYGIESKLDRDINEILQLSEVVRYSNQKMEELIASGATLSKGVKKTPEPAAPSEELKNAEKKYAEELKSLNNQLAAEAITRKEYNAAVNKLNEATQKEIAGILGINAINNETYRKARQGALNPLPIESSEELERAEQKYIDELTTLNNQLAANAISQKEYGKAVDKLNEETYKEIAGILGINAINNEIYRRAQEGVLHPLAKEVYKLPEKEIRDTTFDYKKSELKRIEELYRIQEKYVESLKQDIDKLGEEAVDAIKIIDEEMDKLDSLSDALKLAELKEDIESLNKDIMMAQLDSFVGLANTLDSIARSWSRIANEDMSGFERMIALINALGDTLGGVIRMWESYSKIKEMLDMREKAQAAEQIVLSGQKIAADQAEAISAQTKSASVVAGLKAEKQAATGVMAAKSTAAYADMPFIGMGLAASQIAYMQSLIMAASAIPQFAHGGIVGGTTKTGDRQLIRANSGEMVLTTVQQSKLWNVIRNSKLQGGVGELRVTIRGKDLVGVLKNNNLLMERM